MGAVAVMGPVAVGVDVGQKRDPTAVAVLEVEERPRDGNGRLDDYYLVRHLERLPLGTPYPEVARRVAGIVARLDERAAARVRPAIYLDATGVGQPVVDLLTAAGVTITPVYFTHGDRCTPRQDGSVVLGKTLLVSQLQVLLQSGRILLPRTMEARVLAEELLNFELKVDEKANETYGAFKVGTHDDLVSALGLSIMAAQRRGELPFGWYRRDPVFRGQALGAVSTAARPVAQTTAPHNGQRAGAPDGARPAAACSAAQAEKTEPAETPAPSAMTRDERELQRWLDLVEGRAWR